jgi:hypothetical protein
MDAARVATALPTARASSTVGAVRTYGTNVLQRPIPDLRVVVGMSGDRVCKRASWIDVEPAPTGLLTSAGARGEQIFVPSDVLLVPAPVRALGSAFAGITVKHRAFEALAGLVKLIHPAGRQRGAT